MSNKQYIVRWIDDGVEGYYGVYRHRFILRDKLMYKVSIHAYGREEALTIAMDEWERLTNEQ